MAIERRIIENIHRATEAGEINQIRLGARVFEALQLAKQEGFVDLNDNPSTGLRDSNYDSLQFTPIEARILGLLSQSPNTSVTLAALKTEGWETNVSDQAAMQAISRLRRKIRVRNPGLYTIKTVRGKGYTLVGSVMP